MGVKGLAAPLWTAYKYLKLGNAEWVKTREVLTTGGPAERLSATP